MKINSLVCTYLFCLLMLGNLGGIAVGEELSGTLSCRGSDTMRTIVKKAFEQFKQSHPGVTLDMQNMGSSTAVRALIEGTAKLGLMSRNLNDKEEALFEELVGYKPTRIVIAIDCIALYVNKDNSCKGVTLAQLDAMFSKTRERGYAHVIEKWSQAGVTGVYGEHKVIPYGRDINSGTFFVFQKIAMRKGEYGDSFRRMEDSESIVAMVSENPGGIGYSGMGYKTDGVRFLPIAFSETEPFVEPSFENAMNGSYPIARTLNICLNKKLDKPLPALEKAFVSFLLSEDGQQIVMADGYGSIPVAAREAALKTLE